MRIGLIPRVLTATLAFQLCGCAGLMGAFDSSDRSFQEYRQYMAERAAAEVADPDEQERSIEEVLASARNFHRNRQPDQAMRLYFDAFRLDPSDDRAQEGMAYLQIAKQPERSEAVFSRILEHRPDSAVALAGFGLARFAQGDAASAVAPLERAVELDPTSSNAHNGLAVVLGRLGRLEEALVHARTAKGLAPHDAYIANNLGVAYVRTGNLEAAEAAFREAVTLDPVDSAYGNNLGMTLAKLGRYDDAYRAFRRAGDEQVAQNNVGQMYQLSGQLDEAIVHYELALLAGGEEIPKVLRNLNATLDAREMQQPN